MLRFSTTTRLSLLLAITTALCFALAIGAPRARALPRPHPQRQVKQQIELLEQQWRTAALAGDLGSMENLLSDDYVGISWNGEVNTKAMQLDRIRTRNFVITRLDPLDSKIKLLGNVAIVTARAEVQGTTDGATMSGTFRYTRVYQRVASGAWKITNFEATRVPDPAERHSHGPATH